MYKEPSSGGNRAHRTDCVGVYTKGKKVNFTAPQKESNYIPQDVHNKTAALLAPCVWTYSEHLNIGCDSLVCIFPLIHN